LFQLQLQWRCLSTRSWKVWLYITYRWLVSISLVYGIFDDFITELGKERCVGPQFECKIKWPIYLTHWNISILTVQTLMASFFVTRHHFYPNQPSISLLINYPKVRFIIILPLFLEKMRLSHKIYWILNNISNGLAPLVSIVYWGAVHKKGKFYFKLEILDRK